MSSKGRLWLAIIASIAIIYLTLPIMPFLLTLLYGILGKEGLSIAVNSIFVIILFSFLIIVFKRNKNNYRSVVAVALITLLGAMMAFQYETPEERIHFMEYGALGYLVFMALFDGGNVSVLLSIILISIIGAVDEIIQWFLPNRVGDIRDVFMNIVGGLWGIGICRILNGKI